MARDPASRANNLSPTADSGADAGAVERAAQANRSGQDERRRGWFWHWNGIVTQYAPLIGLKGVGLLNSYTVWTDRREDSPHRGYAFPSQQSEANFYGEDRAELITINKILVALDLIEIRKEMVRKTDEKGRRWKVPQNLYRVKDRPDGIDLTADDVIRVVELADRDKAVYRYIRKIFSSRFEPIDRNNVWHAILEEVGNHPTWQKLAARAAKQEARASARTKAGHRSRARNQSQEAETPRNDEQPRDNAKAARRNASTAAKMTTGHDNGDLFDADQQPTAAGHEATTTAGDVNSGSEVADEESNNGFGLPVEPGSNGLRSPERGSVASSNNGRESSVEPGNTMYYQSPSTTTTTTTSAPGGVGESTSPATSAAPQRSDPGHEGGVRPDSTAIDRPAAAEVERDFLAGDAGPGGSSPQRGLVGAKGGGPLADPSPLVLSLYEAANDRSATRLERILLSELEADAAPPAEAAGSTGPEWVAAALREAVGSGSSFVAPKRIREIVNRWAASGAGPTGPADNRDRPRPVDAPSSDSFIKFARDDTREDRRAREVVSIGREDAAQGDRLWGVVLDILAADDSADDLFRLRGVVPLGEREDGAFVLGAPTRVAARLLDGRHRHRVEQALSSLLPAPTSIAVLDPDQWTIEST